MRETKLEHLQKQIVDNLEALQDRLQEIELEGFEDIQEEMYNQIATLIENTEAAENAQELDSYIFQGKEIETTLDTYQNMVGKSNAALIWPSVLKDI